MNALLLHVAADTTNLGIVGPIFPDDGFEFIPINNLYGHETRTYYDLPARNAQYGKTLADFLPNHIAGWHPHTDPSFETFTYGEPDNPEPKPRAMLKLRLGDILFFVSSLAPFDPEVYRQKNAKLLTHQRGNKNKYVVGFFTVAGVTRVDCIKSVPRLSLVLLTMLEEIKEFIDPGNATNELKALQECGYVTKKGDIHELTDDGKRVAERLSEALGTQEEESAKHRLLDDGLLLLEPVSGLLREDAIRGNHHYLRLRPIDWDGFIVVAGDPERSALLDHAVQLTEGFEKFSFKLNQLGRTILKREMDTLRGARWIDARACNILSEQVMNANPDLTYLPQSDAECQGNSRTIKEESLSS